MDQNQRHSHSFDKTEMSYTLLGSKENYEKFVKLQKVVAENEILKFNPEHIQIHRKQNMLVHARKLIELHKHFQFDYFMKLNESGLFIDQMPLSLHFFMFLITLNNLCTDKQHQKFYKAALKGEILGCYAQTELAHGSDIQNLMTTATYDQEKEEFIIHSPKIEAAKWWIGDLGVYANHAIIFAQLIIKNKKYGLHAFLVPIRDENHNLLPNVEAGDIGPKYGYATKDNGYVLFNNHRIKRDYMLMRYSKVSKSGAYERRGNQRISYATMLIIRSLIPAVCAKGISKATTILTRYSLVRKQFKDDKGNEIPILDYQLQQQKVIPRIAESYALIFGSAKINEIASEVFYDAKQRDVFARLNEAHALSSGVKAIFTADAIRGTQILRRAAGGHGFSMYSGLPSLLSEMGPTPTFQGENSVLHLQTARFLLKCVQDLHKGKTLPQTCMYLEEINNADDFVADFSEVKECLNFENLRKIFLYHSCQRVKKAGEKMAMMMGDGKSMKEAWDYHAGITLAECGPAHTYFWIYQNFMEKIYSGSKNEKVRAVLIKLLLLYGLEKIIERSVSFFETGTITGETLKNCYKARELLLAELRPEALGLVDAFGFHDNTLHSAIGWSDGKVYERLLDWAKNKNVVNKPENLKQIYALWKESKSKFIPKANL